MSLCACVKSRDLLPICPIAVVLVDVDLPYWTSEVEHIVTFTTIFSNIYTAHAQKRLFMNFRCKFRHRRSIRRPWFPIKSAKFQRSGDVFRWFFCILYVKCPPYFYFWFVWPTDLESIPHASTPTSIIPTRFEVDMIIHAELVFSSADMSRDLEQMSYMASHMTKLATKYEDPTPIRSWVMSYNVSRWLYHWKYVLGHCACAEPCDPWVGGQKQLHFWMESPTPICLFTM